jgi:hypothetical protein
MFDTFFHYSIVVVGIQVKCVPDHAKRQNSLALLTVIQMTAV